MRWLVNIFTISLSIVVSLTGCKKDHDEKPFCRIITCTTDGSTYHFTYNADGTMSSVLELPLNQINNYTYAGNILTIITTKSGTFVRKKIITNNSEGFAVNVHTEYNISGSNWFNESHQYNGKQLTKTVMTTSTGTGTVIGEYLWENGNMSKATINGNTNLYTYYADKINQTGDYRHLSELINGEHKFNNRNLTRTSESGGDTFTIDYVFNEEARISSVTALSSGATQLFQYQYECL
jgi:hypothetical protein